MKYLGLTYTKFAFLEKGSSLTTNKYAGTEDLMREEFPI